MRTTNGGVILLAIICEIYGAKALTDPQDIAEIACASDTSIYEFTSTEGYIESPGYPGSYEINTECQWYLNPAGGIPVGQELFVEIEYFSTEPCCDDVNAYKGEGRGGYTLLDLSGSYDAGEFFPLYSSPVTLYFHSDHSVDGEGFRIYWYMGAQSPGQVIADLACEEDSRPLTLRNDTLILESQHYPKNTIPDTTCEWIVTLDEAVDGIFLSVLFFYSYDFLYVYYDGDLESDYDAYFQGLDDVGFSLYIPGNTFAMKFTPDSFNSGFQMVYYPADPACISGSASVLQAGEKAALQSPGHPYDIPEHLSCRWLLEAPEGQKVVLTSMAFDLYGNGLDCVDEYVEILDGDTADTLSLGLFCGNSSFGTIPSSTSALQVYLRTRQDSLDETGIKTGFRFEFEAQ